MTGVYQGCLCIFKSQRCVQFFIRNVVMSEKKIQPSTQRKQQVGFCVYEYACGTQTVHSNTSSLWTHLFWRVKAGKCASSPQRSLQSVLMQVRGFELIIQCCHKWEEPVLLMLAFRSGRRLLLIFSSVRYRVRVRSVLYTFLLLL